MEEKRMDEEQRMNEEQRTDEMESGTVGKSEDEKKDTAAVMTENEEKDAVIEQYEAGRDDFAGEKEVKEEAESISEERTEECVPETDAEKQEETEITVDGLTEKEAAEVRDTLKRFIKAYRDSGEEQETFEWLERQLKEELPEKPEEEIHAMKEEIVESIREYDTDLKDMTRTVESGRTKERWFADRIASAAKGVAVNTYGNYLNWVDSGLKEMSDRTASLIKSGSKHINLDGFLAERHHVDSFNANAMLQLSPYRATSRPWIGGPKGSHDIMIWKPDTFEVLEEYQVAYGKNPEVTKGILKHDLAEGRQYQTCVVPKGQVEAVQKGMPGVKVTDHIGGTDKVKITSKPLSVEEAREMQNAAQKGNIMPKSGWNIYNTRELAIGIGKTAGQTGVMTAAITTGFDLAGRVMKGEEIDSEEVVETALVTGADAGVKAAAGGALTAASERGVLSVIPPGTPAGTIAKIACVGVENIKILWKVAKGDITMSEALEQMGRTSTAMTAGLCCAGVGATTGVEVGAVALSFMPVVGPIVGGLIGGMVGYMAGSKVGETVFDGVKKVAERVGDVVSSAWEGVKNFGSSIAEGIWSLLPW